MLVPTRNRADMAIAAIKSALGCDDLRLQILVSDNSTDTQEANKLEKYCASFPISRVRYFRPPVPVPMAEHWNWAIGVALSTTTATHLGVLTDRFIFREGALQTLMETLSANPRFALVYKFDNVYDHVQPCIVDYTPCSARLLSYPTTKILSENARLSGFELIPVLLNSVIPRTILQSVLDRFGSFCLSISPDFSAGFRILALEAEILVLDRALSFNWGRQRSNGFSFTRGAKTQDSEDFVQNLRRDAMFFETQFADITTVGNAIMHEYWAVKRFIGSQGEKFPEVQVDRYHDSLFKEIHWLEDEELKQAFLSRISHAGVLVNRPKPWPAPWQIRAANSKTTFGRLKSIYLNRFTWFLWWKLLQYGVIGDLPWQLKGNVPPRHARDYALKMRRFIPATSKHVPIWATEAG